MSADDILDAVTDDLLEESDLAAALGRLLQRGVGDLSGLDELRERLARAREELLSRFQLGDILADVRRELDEVVATEQHGIERRMASGNEFAAEVLERSQRRLAELPPDVGGRIRRSRTTTSSSQKRASASTSSSSVSGGKCSILTSRACRRR